MCVCLSVCAARATEGSWLTGRRRRRGARKLRACQPHPPPSPSLPTLRSSATPTTLALLTFEEREKERARAQETHFHLRLCAPYGVHVYLGLCVLVSFREIRGNSGTDDDDDVRACAVVEYNRRESFLEREKERERGWSVVVGRRGGDR